MIFQKPEMIDRLLLLLLAYAFSCANGTGDRDSYEFGQLVRSFAGAPDG